MHALPLSRVALFYAAMLAGGLWFLAWSGDWARLAPFGSPTALVEHSLLGLAAGGGAVLVSRWLTSRANWGKRLAEEFRLVFAGMSAPRSLLIAVLSGIAEELIFRGVLQPAVGVWIAALIFGALHIGPSKHFLPWTIMATVAGLGLGGLAEWTGALLAPIIAHILVNFLNIRQLARIDGRLVTV